MKPIQFIYFCLPLAVAGIFSPPAKAFDTSHCFFHDDMGADLAAIPLEITIPTFMTTRLLQCADNNKARAEIEERLIRQDAAATYYSSNASFTPFLSAYGAIREHKSEFEGPASRELAQAVLRSKPGTIAELLQREALRRKAEIEAAQK